jgi:hypothetical protein
MPLSGSTWLAGGGVTEKRIDESKHAVIVQDIQHRSAYRSR